MSVKRLIPVMLMLIMGCQPPSLLSQESTGVGQEKPVEPAKTIVAPTEIMPEEQLELNKHLLLNDPNINVRTRTANVLLMNQDLNIRQILIDTLSLTDNSAARMAICRALIQTRSSKEPLKNKEDFVQPLLGVFNTKNDEEAQLAAEATLIFEKYEIIRESLEKIVTDATGPIKTRLNAIGALKRRPDMMAAIKLMELVDDPQAEVAEEAEKALHSLGLPVGKDAEARRQNIIEIQRKGKNEFLRVWLINQETQMRQIRIDLESWQKSYLTLLDKTYRSKSDDTEKSKFLVEYLKSPKAEVKLWALEQVYQWIQGTNPNLPKPLEPILISLVSDQDKEVRLKTTGLLASMRTLNSASTLLAQLKVETDEQVTRQLLDTLGWVCSYALSSSSSFKISPEIRQQVLDLAAEFLSKEEANKAQVGAQVMRRLLERDNLKPEEVDKKLKLFVERYNRQKGEQDETLRGRLLNTMAGLVARDSVCKTQAVKLFEQFFSEALDSKADFVREAAVDGLANIDETRALIILRKKSFANDPSSNVRSKMILIAKNVGGTEDLDWLADKIGSNGESQLAWQAMFRIFGASDANVLNKWMDQITGNQSKFSVNQKIDFLKIAEARVTGEDKTTSREKLARLFYNTGQFEQAADYYSRMRENAINPEDKKIISSQLLDAYLRWPNLELAAMMIKSSLVAGDLEPNDVMIQVVDNYLNNQSDENDIDALLKVLAEIRISPPRPKWSGQIKYWINRFRKTSELNKEEILVN